MQMCAQVWLHWARKRGLQMQPFISRAVLSWSDPSPTQNNPESNPRPDYRQLHNLKLICTKLAQIKPESLQIEERSQPAQELKCPKLKQIKLRKNVYPVRPTSNLHFSIGENPFPRVMNLNFFGKITEIPVLIGHCNMYQQNTYANNNTTEDIQEIT